jgi:DNA-binding transcriptional ArsR family regulator
MSTALTASHPGVPDNERNRQLLERLDAVIGDHESLYAAHPLAITIVMTDFFMEYLRNLNQAFDGDMTLCIVLGEIGQANMRRFFHPAHMDGLPPAMADTQTVATVAKGCNGLSVSMATGIPRETVRRKIAQLADMGLIEQHPDGGWVATKQASQRFSPTFNRDLSLRLLQTSRRILEL